MTDEPVNFLARLKQHHLYGVVVAYAVVVAFLIQLVSRAFPYFGWAAAVPAVIIVLLLGFPMVVVLAWLFIKPKDPAKTLTKAAVAAVPSVPPAVISIPAKSIAVLPLVNESGERDQQYFSDGLSENLIIALSQFSGLKVIGRNSSFQFRDSKVNSATIGRKLGVAHLLEGSVQREGEVVRISTELINAADGSTLWSQHYDRPYKNLFLLQDDITKAVASALQAKLLPTTSAVIRNTRPLSGNLDAYDAWLQGKFYSVQRTENSLRHAIGEYDHAIRLDPRYAQAYADRSYAWSDLAAVFLYGQAATNAYTHGREDVQRALSLAPGLADAHLALGYLLELGDLDPVGAESEYRKAVDLAPDAAGPKTNLGLALATLGRLEEGAAQIHQAVQLDPLNSRSYRALADIELALGRLDAAERTIHQAIALQPNAGTNRRTLVYIYVRRGDVAAALREARLEPSEVYREWETTIALQIGSDRVAADAALADFIAKQAGLSNFQIAEAYAVRKDRDKAFAWLDRAWAVRDPGVMRLLYAPFLLTYKDDPYFKAMLKKVSLPHKSVEMASGG